MKGQSNSTSVISKIRKFFYLLPEDLDENLLKTEAIAELMKNTGEPPKHFPDGFAEIVSRTFPPKMLKDKIPQSKKPA